MIIGYARVSTPNQAAALDDQAAQLEAAGAERVYREVASGASKRSVLTDVAVDQLRPGDELVVTALDRLGRRMVDLLLLLDDLTARDIRFRSLREGIDMSTAAGRAFAAFVAIIAETEQRVLVERTRQGLEAARAAGKRGGRPARMTPGKIQRARKMLAEEGATVAGVARKLGVSRPTLYRTCPDEIRWLSASSESGSTGRP